MTVERREGHFASRAASSPNRGEADVFYQTWTTPAARATLVLTHGLGEHSESYWKVADDLARIGYDVIAWDLRGHGRSEGKRGHVDQFEDYSHDLAQLLQYLKKSKHLTKPFVLMAHSMGGLVQFKYLISNEFASGPQPVAAVFSAPLLDVAMAVPVLKDAAAKLTFKIWPSLTLDNGIKDEDLVRDPEWLKTYDKDTLRHSKTSPALYFGMLDAMKDVQQHADRVQLPVLVQAAGHDKIVSTPAIQGLFAQLGSSDKELIVYDESYHEIYNDLDRSEAISDLDLFLKRVIP
ncbi:MAG: alpha/beta hydrolase [Proteobacteria bacterium]|nr:MAG: alpha/beta hydrolase [Pseudomonadota bacterium]